MAQDLSRDKVAQQATPFLLAAAQAMQHRPTFLLTEFVGQTFERAALAALPSPDEEEREKQLEALDARRDTLKQLVAVTEQRVGDLATEASMVQYYDHVLSLGEETAMKKLAEDVRRQSIPP
jgi:hypothetical protein